jgi:tryptophan synthase alpha chain
MYPKLRKKIDAVIKKRRKLFIPYITCGYPTYNDTLKIVSALFKAGADIIELGIPFSDPLADGPTIQKSSQVAIANKMNLRKAFQLLKDIKLRFNIPIVFMSYYNPIYHMGLNRFEKKAKENDLDGLIIPDLPPEEAGQILEIAKKINLAIIFLLSPTSSLERIKMVIKLTKGFIYYVSLTGVTGARKKLPKDIKENVKRIKNLTDTPVCVGFGISKPQHALSITNIADGVIVGSAIINIIEKNKNGNFIEKVYRFAKSLREVL